MGFYEKTYTEILTLPMIQKSHTTYIAFTIIDNINMNNLGLCYICL